MRVDRMLAKMLEAVEECLYDEPLSHAMLVDVTQQLAFALQRLDALLRDERATFPDDVIQLALSRCQTARRGLQWVQDHADAEDQTLFDQLHVACQEILGTLLLLEDTSA